MAEPLLYHLGMDPGREGTVRGFSGVRLIAVDEAARVPDELYAAVRPCSRCPVAG